MQVDVVQAARAQWLAAVGDQGVHQPVPGQQMGPVAEEDQAAAAGAKASQGRETGVEAVVALGIGAVGQQGEGALADDRRVVGAAQRGALGELEVGLQGDAAAGGVDDLGHPAEVGVEQIEEAHQEVLVKRWKPTRFSRKPYGVNPP